MASQLTQVHRTETIEHDFGAAWAGDAIKHTFSLANTSNQILSICSVNTTCGCTTTGTYERKVLPNKVWTIDVTLSTADRKGPIRKTVTVKTDAPDRPEVLLVLKGEVQPRFQFSPTETIMFGPVKADSALKRTLVITNRMPVPVVIRQAVASTTLISVSLTEIERGQRYELDVETVPPLPETGSLGTVVLETDLKEQPNIVVPIYGMVRPRIYLSPKLVSVPTPVVHDVQRTMELATTDSRKIEVVDVEVSNPAIDVVVDPTEGDHNRIQITISQGAELQEKGETITVYTNDPEFPSLTCDVRPYKFGRTGPSRRASSQPATEAPGSQSASSQPLTPTKGDQCNRARTLDSSFSWL